MAPVTTTPFDPDFGAEVLELAQKPDTCASRPPFVGYADGGTDTWLQFCSFPPVGLAFHGWTVENATSSSYTISHTFTLAELSSCHLFGDDEAHTVFRETVSSGGVELTAYRTTMTIYMFRCHDTNLPETGIEIMHSDELQFEVLGTADGSTVVTHVPMGQDVNVTEPSGGTQSEPGNGGVSGKVPIRFGIEVRTTSFNPVSREMEIVLRTRIDHISPSRPRKLYSARVSSTSGVVPTVRVTGGSTECVADSPEGVCYQMWLVESVGGKDIVRIEGLVEVTFAVHPDTEETRVARLNVRLERTLDSDVATADAYGELVLFNDASPRQLRSDEEPLEDLLSKRYIFPDAFRSGETVYALLRLSVLLSHLRILPERIVVCVPTIPSLMKPYDLNAPDRTGCYSDDAGIGESRRFEIYKRGAKTSAQEVVNTKIVAQNTEAEVLFTFTAVPFITNPDTAPFFIQVLYSTVTATGNKAFHAVSRRAAFPFKSQQGQFHVGCEGYIRPSGDPGVPATCEFITPGAGDAAVPDSDSGMIHGGSSSHDVDAPGGSSGGSVAAIVGAVVGILLIFGVISSVFYIRRKRKRASGLGERWFDDNGETSGLVAGVKND